MKILFKFIPDLFSMPSENYKAVWLIYLPESHTDNESDNAGGIQFPQSTLGDTEPVVTYKGT